MSCAVGACAAAADVDIEHGVGFPASGAPEAGCSWPHLIRLASMQISRLLDEQLVALGTIRGAAGICRGWDEHTLSASADATAA